MPIMDYSDVAKRREKRFFNHPGITEKNKDYVKQFLKTYDVSDARKGIFFSHILEFLLYSKDIKKEMNNSESIDEIYAKIKAKGISESYRATIINVILSFVRKLNGGVLPKGFINIKRVSKRKLKRDLKPNDMIEWKEALYINSKCKDVQSIAQFMTQLDFGFRPGEFTDINYGDVEFESIYTTINVKRTKTDCDYPKPWGIRCTPFLQRWMDQHPTKKATDPLWMMCHVKKNQRIYLRYSYDAMRRVFERMGKRAGVQKPMDFYSLRHSSCVLDKKANVPVDMAAARHGHSVDFFINTYGRLSDDDIKDRVKKHFGLTKDQKKKEDEPIICQKCSKVYVPGVKLDFCERCSYPLTEKGINELMTQKNKPNEEIKSLQQQLLELEKTKDDRIKQLESNVNLLLAQYQKEKVMEIAAKKITQRKKGV